MSAMIETARELLMSHTMAQWLYVVSDTNVHNGNLSSMINALYEGENLAYIYNITDNSPDCKVRYKGSKVVPERGFSWVVSVLEILNSIGDKRRDKYKTFHALMCVPNIDRSLQFH